MSKMKLAVVMIVLSIQTLFARRLSFHDSDAVKSRVKRIIGGEDVEAGAWPWLVSLQGKIPDRKLFGITITKKKVYCGASLINSRWLITAAHCFINSKLGDGARDPDNWHAKLGDIELSTSLLERAKGLVGRFLGIDELKNWYIDFDKIIVHPHYDENNLWENDIALVKLDTHVPAGTETPEIQSVRLPSQGESDFPEDGATCVMKGWGCTVGGGSVNERASETHLPKISDEDCTNLYGINTNNRLCAGHNLASKGICSGDSGGPLVCQQRGQWVQVGIASFTSSKRPGDVPGAFTRVSSYVDWILTTVEHN